MYNLFTSMKMFSQVLLQSRCPWTTRDTTTERRSPGQRGLLKREDGLFLNFNFSIKNKKNRVYKSFMKC